MGENEEGKEIQGYISRFGPYVRIGKKFFSLPKDLGTLDVELVQVLELYRERREKYVGVRDFRTAWNNLRCIAGLPNLQVKDLRTFFNWLLGTKSDLSNKELGRYIGNTERVNLDHYTLYSLESSNEKLSRFVYLNRFQV